MNHHYNDIRSLTDRPPLWWDENAVPRYCEPEPDAVADIYAVEVAFVDIACQNCGAPFLVAFVWGTYTHGVDESGKYWVKMHEPLTPESVRQLHYGDPPNAGCCASGPTMNSEPQRVREFWRRHHPEYVLNGIVTDSKYFEWRRVPELEVEIECEWARG